MEPISIALTREDYIKCLSFSLKMWYSESKGVVDFRSTGTKRDIGKYCTDFIIGKLAEIAFAKFMEEEYGITIGLDFNLHPGITAVDKTDILWVRHGCATAPRPPSLRVDVKGTKPTSKYFLVDAREYRNRPYDAYVMVFVDMPSDHLIRAVADLLELPADLKEKIKPLKNIEAKIVGFCWRADLENQGKHYSAGTVLEDPEKPRKKLFTLKVDNIGFPVSNLRKTKSDWRKLALSIAGEE
jgi:hypothetical protein